MRKKINTKTIKDTKKIIAAAIVLCIAASPIIQVQASSYIIDEMSTIESVQEVCETIPGEEQLPCGDDCILLREEYAIEEITIQDEENLEELEEGIAAKEVITLEPEVSVDPDVIDGYAVFAKSTTEFTYLSDIIYDLDKSFCNPRYNIMKDSTVASETISLMMNGEQTFFMKGTTAWATSELVYDIQDMDYDYFSTYLGIEYRQQHSYSNNGNVFYIYTSLDGEEWEQVYTSGTMNAWTEAKYVEIELEGANYIKLYAYENGSIGNHWTYWYDEAVYADAKFYNEGYVAAEDVVFSEIKTVEEYEATVRSYNGSLDISGAYEFALLQRNFVDAVGYNELQALANLDANYLYAINWLLNDYKHLKQYITGGEPDGSHTEAIKILSRMLTAYESDFSDTTPLDYFSEYNTTRGDLYKTMAITIAITHSAPCGLWGTYKIPYLEGVNTSQPEERYREFKKLYLAGKLDNHVYETLEVEEMRFVMNFNLDDESIVWMNDYVAGLVEELPESSIGVRNPYTHTWYNYGTYNYWDEKYHLPEMYDSWNEKYKLAEYGISYVYGEPKSWIYFEEGGVCGCISQVGSTLHGVHGVPSSVVSQPGHAAYIWYGVNDNGDGIWYMGNSLSGWQQSGRTEKLSIRMPNGWGSSSAANGRPLTYILLAQEALNDMEAYEASELVLELTEIYADDADKLEEIYRKATEIQTINFDAWLGLVDLYLADDSKTEEECFALAEEIAAALTYHPYPVNDLLNMLVNKFTTGDYIASYKMLIAHTIQLAVDVTSENSLQPTDIKNTASYLQGVTDTTVVSFSFDGENPNTLMLAESYHNLGVVWEYSLDAGETWTTTEEHEVELTTEQLDLVTAENDILIHLVGRNYDAQNIITLDITSGSTPSGMTVNDLENIIFGYNESTMQWYSHTEEEWKSGAIEDYAMAGDTELLLRFPPTGMQQSGEPLSIEFTSDDYPLERQYVPISHLSIADYSSAENYETYAPEFAIDGNINTFWHNVTANTDFDRYIVIELDMPIVLSALENVPRQDRNAYGIMKDAEVLVSMDGEEWTSVALATNWAADRVTKIIEIPEEDRVLGKFVKVVCVTPHYTSYISAAMLNLFEDTTMLPDLEASIEYSTQDPTNGEVTATLIQDDEDVVITNNNGESSYIFSENGSFTFEFENERGQTGTAIATVENIDKVAPTAEIEYGSYNVVLNQVTVTLVNNSEEIIITNNEGMDTYTFIENGIFTFEYKDLAGNTGQSTAIVTNILSIEPEVDSEEPTIPEVGPEIENDTKPDLGLGEEPEVNIPESGTEELEPNQNSSTQENNKVEETTTQGTTQSTTQSTAQSTVYQSENVQSYESQDLTIGSEFDDSAIGSEVEELEEEIVELETEVIEENDLEVVQPENDEEIYNVEPTKSVNRSVKTVGAIGVVGAIGLGIILVITTPVAVATGAAGAVGTSQASTGSIKRIFKKRKFRWNK